MHSNGAALAKTAAFEYLDGFQLQILSSNLFRYYTHSLFLVMRHKLALRGVSREITFLSDIRYNIFEIQAQSRCPVPAVVRVKKTAALRFFVFFNVPARAGFSTFTAG